MAKLPEGPPTEPKPKEAQKKEPQKGTATASDALEILEEKAAAKQVVEDLKEGKKPTKRKKREAREVKKEEFAEIFTESGSKVAARGIVESISDVPDDPKFLGILSQIVSAPRQLREDPNWLLAQGYELRSTLRADMPDEMQAQARRVLKNIYQKIADIEGIDMSNPKIRISQEPKIKRKVEFVELAGNELLPESGRVPAPAPGGGAEWELYNPATAPAGLSGKLQRLLEDKQEELNLIERKRASREWVIKTQEDLQDLIIKDARGRRPDPDLRLQGEVYIEILKNRLEDLRTLTEGLGPGFEQYVMQYDQLKSQHDQATRAFENVVSPRINIGDPIADNASLSALVGDTLFANSQAGYYSVGLELQSLLNNRDPKTGENIAALSNNDRSLATALARYSESRSNIFKLYEEMFKKASLEDLKRYFPQAGYNSQKDIDFIFDTMGDPLRVLKSLGFSLDNKLDISYLSDIQRRQLEAKFGIDVEEIVEVHGIRELKKLDETDISHLPDIRKQELQEFLFSKGNFEKQVLRNFSTMFSQADNLPSNEWQEVFSIFYHQPVYHAFLGRLRHSIEGIKNLYAEKNIVPPTYGDGSTLVARLEGLHDRLRAIYEMREYTHEINYIGRLGLDMKTLSQIAAKLHSSDVDIALQDPIVQNGYRDFVQVLRNEARHNLWEMRTTWLQYMREGKGVPEEISERVRELLHERFPDAEDWEINGAIAIGRGAALGIYGDGLDIAAECLAPSGTESYGGYAWSGILSAYNHPIHFDQRWLGSKASEFVPLMYLPVIKKPRTGGNDILAFPQAWDPSQLKDIQEEYGKQLLMNVRQYEKAAIPFIQYQNPLSVGLVESRHGWRKFIASQPFYRDLPKLPHTDIQDWPYIDFRNVQPNVLQASAVTLENMGLNYMLFWSEEIGKQIAKGNVPDNYRANPDQYLVDAGLSKSEIYKKMLKRDPLFFVERDSTLGDIPKKDTSDHRILRFRSTIASRALGRLGHEWETHVESVTDPYNDNERRRFRTTRVGGHSADDLDRVLKNAANFMADNGLREWNNDVSQALQENLQRYFEKYQKMPHLEAVRTATERVMLANRYYDNIAEVVSAPYNADPNLRRGNGIKWWYRSEQTFKKEEESTSFFDEFVARRVPFSIGNTTTNFAKFRLADTGPDTLKRATGDAAMLATEVAQPHIAFPKVLKAVGETKKFDKVYELFDKAEPAMLSVHGESKFYEWAGIVENQALAYIQKAWWARVPGVGWLASYIRGPSSKKSNWLAKWGSSWSRINGRYNMGADEQEIGGLIEEARKKHYISDKEELMLRQQRGGRWGQIGLDVIRSYVPIIFGLAIVAGFGLGVKDTEEK